MLDINGGEWPLGEGEKGPAKYWARYSDNSGVEQWTHKETLAEAVGWAKWKTHLFPRSGVEICDALGIIRRIVVGGKHLEGIEDSLPLSLRVRQVPQVSVAWVGFREWCEKAQATPTRFGLMMWLEQNEPELYRLCGDISDFYGLEVPV